MSRLLGASPTFRVLTLPLPLGGKAQLLDIPNTLEAMRAIVGGGVEQTRCRIGVGVRIWLDEEGRLKGLPENIVAGMLGFGPPIFGPAFLARLEADGSNASLTSQDLKALEKYAWDVEKIRELVGEALWEQPTDKER